MEIRTYLAGLYRRALGACKAVTGRWLKPAGSSGCLEPGYEEATRYLHLAVTGVDVAELQAQLGDKGKADRGNTTAALQDTTVSTR